MKTKHIQLIGVVAFLTILFSSCWFMGPSVKGNGKVTEETRQVDEFDQIKVSRGMNVYNFQELKLLPGQMHGHNRKLCQKIWNLKQLQEQI